jgi:hypothetical protein
MARAKDLAGLAALGALGYMLTRDKDSKPTRAARPESTETREEPRRQITDYMKKAPEAEDANYGNEGRRTSMATGRVGRGSSVNMKEEETPSGDTSVTETVKTPASTVSSSEKGMKNYVPRRKSTVSSSAEGMKNYAPRRAPAPESQIPGQDRSGPTGGERVSGTELSRNVSNTMNALAPLGGGFGKIGAELATAGRAQRGYNAAQAARRSAEGMSPAEALAAKEAAAQAAREAKTLNPNAWLAGPKGMAENFRKGGAVKTKKMASGGMTASSRADGIASRGKTKCKMY